MSTSPVDITFCSIALHLDSSLFSLFHFLSHPLASHFGQSLLQLDSSQSTLNSQIQGQAKLLNEVSILSLIASIIFL